jgi:hypothetical protein
MTATVVTTITTPEMKGCGKYHQASVEVNVARPDGQRLRSALLAMERLDTRSTNAGGVPPFRRHERKQCDRDVAALAPTGALVSAQATPPAVIFPAA